MPGGAKKSSITREEADSVVQELRMVQKKREKIQGDTCAARLVKCTAV